MLRRCTRLAVRVVVALGWAATGAADPVLDLGSLPDPTRPTQRGAQPNLDARDEAAGSISLDSILYSDERRVAMINGRLLNEGDVVQGVRVVSVQRDAVIVKAADKPSQKLKLSSARVHIRPTAAPAQLAAERAPGRIQITPAHGRAGTDQQEGCCEQD